MPGIRPTLAIRGGHISWLVVTALVLAGAGLITLTVALTHQHHAPQPNKIAALGPLGPTSGPPTSAPATDAPSGSAPTTAGRTPARTPTHRSRVSLSPGDGTLRLPTSAPTHLTIPAIKVSSSLLNLGLNPDGSAEVPSLAQVGTAGWYRYSATPGTPGSAVMLGHIDSATYGSGVFYQLGSLQPGDEIDVRRRDDRTAVFRVDRVAEYPKTSFPTQRVYGATTYASLRLITCGGTFNPNTHNYLDNIVVFATLVAARP